MSVLLAGQAPMTAHCAHAECEYEQVHRHCSSCGTSLPGPGPNLCPHHHNPDTEWAAANRVFCDFLHRGVDPPPVVLEPRPPVEYDPTWA